MQLRRSPNFRGLLLVVAISVVAAACGGGGGTNEQGAPRAPATTAPATTSADPLEGEWRTEFTCEDSLRAIQARLSENQILDQVGSWKEFMGGWGGEPTDDDPCRGATATVALLVRFADGNLGLFEAETGEVGATAQYELVDDHSISVSDEQGNLCEETGDHRCPVTWEFEIAGDELTFHVHPDAFVIGAWESAPFVRVS